MLRHTVIMLLFLVLLAFLSTGWVVFAALGLFIGLLCKSTFKWFRCSSKTIRRITLTALFLFVVLSLVLTSNLHYGLCEAPQKIVISVWYTAIMSPSADSVGWEIQEDFLLDMEDIPDFSVSPEGFEGLSHEVQENTARRQDELIDRLDSLGWNTTGQFDGMEQFKRTRYQSTPVVWYHATTTTEIALEIGTIETSTHRIRFFPDSRSELIIYAPKHLVASTNPSYSDRTDQYTNGERLMVPLNFSRQEEPRFSLTILNPVLRWPLGSMIGSLSLWSVLKWIILALFSVFSGQLKEKVLKPIISCLFPSRKKIEDKTKEKKKIKPRKRRTLYTRN